MSATAPSTPGLVDILDRLRRIQVTIGLGGDQDITRKSRFKLLSDGSALLDISGGMTHDQLVVLANAAINGIASFRDNCITFFRTKGLDKHYVLDALAASQDLKLITDLDNFNKH